MLSIVCRSLVSFHSLRLDLHNNPNTLSTHLAVANVCRPTAGQRFISSVPVLQQIRQLLVLPLVRLKRFHDCGICERPFLVSGTDSCNLYWSMAPELKDCLQSSVNAGSAGCCASSSRPSRTRRHASIESGLVSV